MREAINARTVKTPEILCKFIKDMIYDPKKASIDLDKIDPEYSEVANGLLFLKVCIDEENGMAAKMAEGDLDIKTPDARNVLAYPLKSLHASLKHLVWQAKQIQKGDYSQQVDFMGEFSDVFNNMTRQLSERRNELEAHAFRDPLTRLFNRRYGMEILSSLISEKRPFSLCFADLDNLKFLNDRLGHGEGDRFIIDTARCLERRFIDGIAARVGGDEFMILVPGVSAQETENRMASALLELRAYGKRPDGQEKPVMSYGVVEVPETNTYPASRILARADKKMYTMKAQHKEQFSGD